MRFARIVFVVAAPVDALAAVPDGLLGLLLMLALVKTRGLAGSREVGA